jgi:hypothetical protein
MVIGSNTSSVMLPSGAAAIPGWPESGIGVDGLPNYGPPNTGNTSSLPNYGNNTGDQNPPPDYGNNTGGIQIPDLSPNGNVVGGGFGAGGIQSQPTLTYSSVPPSILNNNGALPPGIGGLGTPIPMPASADPNQTAQDFAKGAFNGQIPLSVQQIGGGWLAKLPDGTSILYRPAGQATDTPETTSSVDINSAGIRAINNNKPAKSKFPSSK